jgi:hypothetical protein
VRYDFAMADGALNLTIAEDAALRLAERAQSAGVTPEVLAAEMLSRLLDEPATSSRPATRPEDYDGPYVELEDALAAFDQEFEQRLAKRAE